MRPSFKTLMKKIKSVVIDEYEFENREKSILIQLFGFFGPSAFEDISHYFILISE